MIGRTFDAHPVYPWAPSVLRLLKGACFFVNLETTVTTHAQKWPDKVFNFRIAPFRFEQLLPPERLVVNLANNHALDYNLPGFMETVTTLTTLGIPYAGVRREQPAILVHDNVRIGVIGYSDHPREWKNSPLSFFDPSRDSWEEPLQLIGRTAKLVHIVVVYLHFGPNWVSTAVSEVLRAWMRACVDAGAKVVVNTSAHHVLPVETYKAGLILHSPGSVVDDYAVDQDFRNDLGLLARVIVDDHGSITDISLHPTKVESMQVRLLRPTEREYERVWQDARG